jgi:hypothetical protein
VNPRRSQNSTVASTRSPGEARRGVGAREQLTHHLLGHEALEGRADAAAGADLDRVRQRDGAGGAEHEREQRDDEAHDRAGVERELGSHQQHRQPERGRHERPEDLAPRPAAQGRKRRDQAGDDRHQRLEPPRRVGEGEAAEHRVRGRGLDLGPAHLARLGGAVVVLQDGRDRADDDELAAHELRIELAADDVRDRDLGQVLGRAGVVDPRPLATERALVDGLGARGAGGHRGELRNALHAAGDAPDGAVDVEAEVAVGDAHAVAAQVGAVEHDWLPADDAGGAEDEPRAGPSCSVEERGVLVRGAGVGELDVVGDHARSGAQQLVDDAAVQRPRKHLGVDASQRGVVESDDDDVLGRGLGAADGEALVHRVELELVEHARRPDPQRDPGGQQPHRNGEGRTWHRTTSPHESES